MVCLIKLNKVPGFTPQIMPKWKKHYAFVLVGYVKSVYARKSSLTTPSYPVEGGGTFDTIPRCTDANAYTDLPRCFWELAPSKSVQKIALLRPLSDEQLAVFSFHHCEAVQLLILGNTFVASYTKSFHQIESKRLAGCAIQPFLKQNTGSPWWFQI